MNYNPNRVLNADVRVLHTLMGLAAHFGKGYCFPSQATILRLLEERAHRHMSRRSLNRHLGSLEARGLIVRRRRHQAAPGRGWIMRSTLYSFTAMTYALMRHTARAAALWLCRARVPRLAQYVTHMLGRLTANSDPERPAAAPGERNPPA